MKTLTLIDGSGFIFRAYHSLPPLTNPAGVPVGAVYGFINMLAKYTESSKTDAIAVIFDVSRNTFRNRIYPQYKANRPPPPDDLIPQFALVREAARALNLPVIEKEDYEADDLIASYARTAKNAGWEVTIISSDKDLMQLVCEGIKLYDPMKQKPIGAPEVLEKFGVPPEKVLDVLSLMGDSSDNVPGVPGIGPKTACELINTYGDLDTLLARASEIKQNKRRESMIQYADQARMSRDLIRLKEDVELPEPLENLGLNPPLAEKLLPFLEQQGFKSLIGRFTQKFGFTPDPAPVAALPNPVELITTEAAVPVAVTAQYSLVQTESVLKQWIHRIQAAGFVAVDTETTSVNAMQAELVGVSLCVSAGEACYIPVGHVEKGSANVDLFNQSSGLVAGQLSLPRVVELLKPILEDASILKIGHNIKYDMLVLRKYGIHLAPLDDTMLLSYTLTAGSHAQNMDELAERYLQHKTISYDDVTGTGRGRISFAEVELPRARDYAAEDADITLRLYRYFKPQLFEQHMLTLYETIERPLIPVITAMESRGVKVDASRLTQLSHEFSKAMQSLESEICGIAGCEFNVGSPKQLGEILFEALKIPGGKKGKTGAYSTDAYVLEQLAEEGYDIATKIMEWRQLSKLKGTYTDTLVQQIHPKTQRVHTSFSLAVTSTGRLSSSDPNLQNIPIRTELGRSIRTAFVAEEGNVLISADYSQIELRLLAHIAHIEPLTRAFKEGRDIHAATASEMFGVPVEAVDSELRRKAKTINFGIIYGISAHGLATRLGISRGEAASYIDQYFTQYPGIRQYMEETKDFARRHGYVTTLFGRRCHIPGIHNKNGSIRQFSERAAINAPLQGTAADIIKRAMITIEGKLQESLPQCKMLLQVHDELVFEAPDGQAAVAIKLIVPAMESAAHLSIPLTVEAKAGRHWGEAH